MVRRCGFWLRACRPSSNLPEAKSSASNGRSSRESHPGLRWLKIPALRPEECFALRWRDIDPTSNQILVQRAWSKGRGTDGKTKGSMKSVAMHPALYEFLNEWRKESCDNLDEDWVFARVVRREECCEPHLLAENTTYAPLQRQPASSPKMIIHDSVGTISGTVWRHSLDQTRSSFGNPNDAPPCETADNCALHSLCE
jgi:integrase